MVDVKITEGTTSGYFRGCWGPYWTSATTGYAVINANTASLEVWKTTDSGATWAEQDSADAPVNDLGECAVWYEQETPGDTGTKLLIARLRQSTTNKVSFATFDTATDQWSAEVDISASFAVTSSANSHNIALTKTRGGNLIAAARGDETGTDGAWKSTNGGATWSAVADVYDASSNDILLLFPGNEADAQDAWGLYFDASVGEVDFVLYDDSANTWTFTNITTGIVGWDGFRKHFWNGAVRNSDRHLLVAFHNNRNSAANDFLCYDINGAASITAKTQLLTNVNAYFCGVLVNQQNDDVYIAYAETAFATPHIWTKKSTDGMATWGAAVQHSATARNYQAVSLGRTVGTGGGRVLPIGINVTDEDTYATDTANSVEITGSGGGASGAGGALMLLGVG